MLQGKLRVTFFGPIDGLQFHTIPAPTLPAVYGPPAIASVYEFAQSGAALMVAKRFDIESRVSMTWIGIYQQTFEKDLDRRGHSFGVGIWFFEKYPLAIVKVVEALGTLHSALALRCFSEGRFCGKEQFLDFIRYFEPKFTNFCEQMFPQWGDANYGTGLSIDADATAFHSVADLKDFSNMGRLLAWSLWAPGASDFQKLIFAEPTSGSPGPGTIVINNLEQRSGDAYVKVVEKLNSIESKFSVALSATVQERDQLKTHVSKLSESHKTLEFEVGNLKKENKSLQTPLKSAISSRPLAAGIAAGSPNRGDGQLISQLEERLRSADMVSKSILEKADRVERNVSVLLREQEGNQSLLTMTFWLIFCIGFIVVVGAMFGGFFAERLWNVDANIRNVETSIKQSATQADIQRLDDLIKKLGVNSVGVDANKKPVQAEGGSNSSLNQRPQRSDVKGKSPPKPNDEKP